MHTIKYTLLYIRIYLENSNRETIITESKKEFSDMDINKTILKVNMQATHPVKISRWTGSMIRGAIKSALAYKHCKNIRYENCNKCKYEDCPNKFLFDRKETGSGRIEANLVVLDTPFFENDTVTDNLEFSIIVFENIFDEVGILRELLTEGIRMGEPRVLWQAVKFEESEDTIQIPDYKQNTDKICSCRVYFDTPVVSNQTSEIKGINLTPENFVKLVTRRLAGISNTAELGYMVPYAELIQDASNFAIIHNNLTDIELLRKSTTKNRIDCVKAKCGSIELSGRLESFYPYLKLISNLNIGKECTMGLGKYSVSELEYEV